MTPGWQKLRQRATTVVKAGVQMGRSVLVPSFRRTVVTADAAKAVWECARWMEDYLGQAHLELGRNGEICPYIKAAMRKEKVSYRCYDGVTTISARTIGDILLFEGVALEHQLDPRDEDADVTAICVLFPRLEPVHFPKMAEAHERAKGALMSRGMMLAVFYPGYEKGALYNPAFKLYQSPYPIAAIRPMAIRDIAFLEYHREAFAEYRRRFAGEFASGEVSNKFGHVDRYRAAEQRFPP